ncbi:hypothetical protein GINT2_000501 [Glugoides intestinalis]
MYRDNYSSNGSSDRRSNYNSYDRRRGGNNNERGPRGSSVSPMNPNEEPILFEKNLYLSSETLTEEDAKQLRDASKMRLIGNDIPLPVKSFSDLGFPEDVLKHFASMKYDSPTPIQAQGWPMALCGRDMVGIADTGSGKTISFVLPAMVHAKNQQALREDDGPIVLILAPTRELCTQIEEVVREYAGYYGLRSTSVYGGASMVPQKKALKRGVEILVATPGRLIDLHEQGFCPLGRVTFLVLDEADRMLDMGFEPQLNKIIPKTHKDRQSLMWSATWPREVRSLAMEYMKNFIQVTVGDDDLKANSKIVQKVDFVEWQDKKNKLLYYLQDHRSDRVIVFCNMKRTCDTLEDFLHDKGFHAVALHGDKTQAIRDSVIQSFKTGRRSILIATDVAARGLDVKDVKLVINYDFPKNIEDYVHRIGRTARGNTLEGLAYTMLVSDDMGNGKKLIEVLKQSNQEVSRELEDAVMRMKRQGGGGRSHNQSQNRYGSFSGGYGNQQRR